MDLDHPETEVAIKPVVFDKDEATGSSHLTEMEQAKQKNKSRAERFGVVYVAPKKETVFPTMEERRLHKYEQPSSGLVTGFDLFSKQEQEKKASRMERFGVNEAVEEADIGMDSAQTEALDNLMEKMVQPDPNALWRDEAIYVYGVDYLSTQDIVRYFRDYGMDRVEWIDDSSCNAVFRDPYTAQRALEGKAFDRPPQVVLDGDDAADPQTEVESPLWRVGKTISKGGKSYPLMLRMATVKDVKSGDTGQSKFLWLKQSGGRGRRNRQKNRRKKPYDRDTKDEMADDSLAHDPLRETDQLPATGPDRPSDRSHTTQLKPQLYSAEMTDEERQKQKERLARFGIPM